MTEQPLEKLLADVKIYIPRATKLGKAIRPINLDRLLKTFALVDKISYIDRLDKRDIDGKICIVPVFLGLPKRLKAQVGDFAYYSALAPDEIATVNASDSCYFLLDMALESLSSLDHHFAAIHTGASEAGISVERLIIVNCNLQSAAAYRDYCEKRKINKAAHIVQFNYCMWMLIGNNRSAESLSTRDHLWKMSRQRARKRSKKFLSTNGRLRPHRAILTLFLHKNHLLEQGHVSLIGYNDSVEAGYKNELESALRQYPQFSSLASEVTALASRLPLTLDTEAVNLRDNRAMIMETLPWTAPSPDLYLDSYLSVVTETVFAEQRTTSVTEKLFKPIMSMHPVIVLGGQGTLSEMRKMGFRSFAPLIDETYDTISDHQERLRLALEEARRLANLPIDELHETYFQLLPVLEHNFDLFWNELFPAFEPAMASEILSTWSKDVNTASTVN